MRTITILAMTALIFAVLASPADTRQLKSRLKDIARIQNASGNHIIGYGLVVGLAGTGDTMGSQRGMTSQTIQNMLKTIGATNVPLEWIRTRNAAVVTVTAVLPGYAKAGDTVDVIVSSLGDAQSLQGGTLLMANLKAADNEVYVLAQGTISTGGLNYDNLPYEMRRNMLKNHTLVARIPAGGTIVKSVENSVAEGSSLVISLYEPDFTTASRVAEAINAKYPDAAVATDPSTVKVTIPDDQKGKEVAFVAILEQLTVIPDDTAKVAINERTGTVVLGEDVKIGAVAVAHGNIKVEVAEGVTLGQLVEVLNAAGVSPRDFIAIVQAMRRSGAIKAEIELM
jgi:flagellar P-ring protein precursor FlgI